MQNYDSDVTHMLEPLQQTCSPLLSDAVKIECMGVAFRRLHVEVDICDGRVQRVHLFSLQVRKLYVTQIHLCCEDVPTRRCQVVTGLCRQQVAPLHITETANVMLCTAGVDLYCQNNNLHIQHGGQLYEATENILNSQMIILGNYAIF